MAKDKDIWDILSSISMLISGGLIAAVGVIATIIYDNRQLKLAQIEALDKYRVQLLSDNPAERVFSYEAFVALGYAELAAKLIAVRNDPAGESVLVQLAENPDSKVREIAKQGLLSLDDQRRIRSIVDVFETGSDQINYRYLEIISGKTVGLIYGRGQATRGSG
ncbi:MAG TPA: hypothetical protein VLA52_10950, partial [Thermohalobaculum sp.]|nr:hypothetical protein [Thermohalobaculum sp.]